MNGEPRPGTIEHLLAQLSPQQETVLLLREIRDLLKKHFDGDDDRPRPSNHKGRPNK